MREDVSQTELLILEYLWSRDTPAKFAEIMQYCNEVKQKEWKKQTVNTFLTRLAQKNFIMVDKTHSRALYSPVITEEEYYQRQAEEMINESFNGSIKNFLCAFTGNRKLSREEKDELLDYIERL